ncbi:hypothetical protein [Oecophyllibacter saccharovorans]|uniref:Terminase n=1 Tax=Oecophyllibacter saccharovorans TaxID=2558360 RepID=A0A506UM55_9PROT|nr:hypothetical protein [Oecophyllibacter saccharovorans]TPW34421.1 hypothetical protein E3202_08010 [Oecophyllibacter saccharovorans]
MSGAREGEIILPAHGWRPRAAQWEAWDYLQQGGTRLNLIAHRRFGKDDLALNWTSVSAMQRVGNYWHMLPEAAQARKAIWTAVNPHTGRRRVDEAFPPEIRARTLERDMFIEFINGSTWQVLGSDNYNSLVGATPVGVVFSEWALANPSAWGYVEPMLSENGGWALFITTPRGRNHAWRMFQATRADPAWFTAVLRASETGIFTAAQLEASRAAAVALYGEEEGLAKFEQEYECSFDAQILGAYYGRLMRDLHAQGRIGDVPHNPALPCVTAWDLGIGDSTVIWIAQQVGPEVRVIDCIAGSGVGMDWYVRELEKRPYIYRQHLLPHDAGNSELGTGERRIDTLRRLGVRPVRVLPRGQVDDGIQAVRNLLPRCRFDRARCERGIDALEQYRRSYDDLNKRYRDRPLHDWASDYADAFRYLAVGLRDRESDARTRPQPRVSPLAGPNGWQAF